MQKSIYDTKVKKSLSDFETLKDFYYRRNRGCGKGHYGKIYVPKNTNTEIIYPSYKEKKITAPYMKLNGKNCYNVTATIPIYDKYDFDENVTKKSMVYNYLCNSWSCAHCRPILKNKLFNDCLTAVNQFDIKYHLILTSKGKDFRAKYYWWESYPIMSKEWNKLRKIINYGIWKLNNEKFWPYQNYLLDDKYENMEIPENISYLRFVRSQNNPTENNPIGYCHNHIGVNLPLNKEWIDEIIQKNNMKIGYSFITENKQFLDYLTGDFFTDEEYVIPLGIRHYNTSKDIIARIISTNQHLDGSIQFGKKATFELIDQYMWKQYNTVLPFEEYLKKFYEIQN